MKNKKCKCGGKFQELSIYDDWDHKVTCNKCGIRVDSDPEKPVKVKTNHSLACERFEKCWRQFVVNLSNEDLKATIYLIDGFDELNNMVKAEMKDRTTCNLI